MPARRSRLWHRDAVGAADVSDQPAVPARALEDTLIYCIPDEQFQELWKNDENFADFVEIEDRTRLRTAVSRKQKPDDLMNARVTRLISRPPVTAPATIRLQEAARVMTDEGVSALLLMKETDDGPTMVGIITDRDMRTRALTEALPSETPIADIMSSGLITVRSDAYLFEAMLIMLHNNVHHLPVVEKGQPGDYRALRYRQIRVPKQLVRGQ